MAEIKPLQSSLREKSDPVSEKKKSKVSANNHTINRDFIVSGTMHLNLALNLNILSRDSFL